MSCDVRHLLTRGKKFLILQFLPTCLFLDVRICLLCLNITDVTISCFKNRFELGKFFFRILKNNFPKLVFTLKEKGGLNYTIFLLLFLFSLFLVCSLLPLLLYFSSALKPLFLRASSYVLFAASKYPGYMKYLLFVYEFLWVVLLKKFSGWLECLLM